LLLSTEVGKKSRLGPHIEEVLHSPVWVVKGGPEGLGDLLSFKPHLHQLKNSLLVLGSSDWEKGVAE